MNDINKLGKMTEVIGKLLFGLLVAILIVLAFAMQLTKYQNKDFSEKIAVVIGAIVSIGVLYIVLRLLFRPIYNLNRNIQLRKEGKLNFQQFKTKWLMCLICSIIICLLPIIPTYGLSIVVMIPQFLLLHHANRNLIQQTNLSNFQDVSTIDRFLSHKSKFRLNLKNMTKQEQLILITIIGIVAGLLLGYITGENQYYTPTGRRINLNNADIDSVKIFKFNYLLFFCGFAITSGVCYLLISRIYQKKQ
ncbi:hypothetical protein JI747_016245 [Chryseobacterium sp. RG1]|uniref:Uncharacterized protein n=1 Tax=Chryseobacterium tagetis TaxID=2801334 RepID=A0ABS8A420_9FLAO|nr:hypothetical protein [Chryseobacterium tagetis]MCA6068719.1 hypothetical protein [Chryseobacterium tagetis]